MDKKKACFLFCIHHKKFSKIKSDFCRKKAFCSYLNQVDINFWIDFHIINITL